MLMILLILFLVFIVLGVTVWERNWILSCLFFSPLILILFFIGYIFYHSLYEPTSDSLQRNVYEEIKIE